jgi:hypothetical protein
MLQISFINLTNNLCLVTECTGRLCSDPFFVLMLVVPGSKISLHTDYLEECLRA